MSAASFFFTETPLWHNCEGNITNGTVTRIIVHYVKISHKFVLKRTSSLFAVSALPTFIETRYILSCSNAGPVCICIWYVNLVIIVLTDGLVAHYDDVIMTMLASQITSLAVVYSIVYLGVNQRKHQSSASLAFVREIHRGPVNFPHKWPVTRKMFPFDDVIM